jgi:putative alpha-1,2-mannosidase
MANFSNVFSTGKKVPFGLAATSPDLSNMFQGYRNLNINQPVDIYSSAQADWERQRADLLRPGANDVATIVGLTNLGQSPSQQKLAFEQRKEEANIARQARKEDIAALIEQKRVFDKEKAERDFKYGMIASIPQTISQSLGNVAALNALAGREITSAYSNTLANYPRPQFSTFNFQPEKYFG